MTSIQAIREQLVEASNPALATCQAPRPADPGGVWSLEADAKLKALCAEALSMDELIARRDRSSGTIERRLFKLAIVVSRRQVLERQVGFQNRALSRGDRLPRPAVLGRDP